MVTLTMRPYVGEDDLPGLVALMNASEVFDGFDGGMSVDELRDEITYPGFDPARDLAIWESADRTLIATANIWFPPTGDTVDAFVGLYIDPTCRDGVIEGELLAWAERRTREIGREKGLPARLRARTRADRPEQGALLERFGFAPARYFLRMARSLAEPIPAPQFPAGFMLRPLSGADEVPAWVELFNLSFIDHWNHHELTVEERLHWLTTSDYQAEQDLIAVAPDGTLAAFCVCMIHPEQNAQTGRSEGWINLLGTRRGYRQIGLGRAMLLAGLHQLKADGMTTALLGVDADSPTGATRLYESVGFSTVKTMVAYLKEL